MNTQYEVIIIGGSYSGLSAAMALGRSLRNVLIIDSGKPCNTQTPHSHNFITHDGETPAAIADKAKAQVLQYPTVTFSNDTALTALKTDTGFSITTLSGQTFTAKKVLLATGVKDVMPAIDGFAACWGISILHCPYCHGYEVKGKKTAVIANGEMAWHFSMLLLQWTKDLTIFTNGPAELTIEQRQKLQSKNIEIVEEAITAVKHTNGYAEEMVLQDGSVHPFTVVYAKIPFIQHSDIAQQLGCAFNEHRFITVNDWQKTSVEGVYASGDCTTQARSLAVAVAAGMKAGAGINSEMAMANF